jgi:hypothetical protein
VKDIFEQLNWALLLSHKIYCGPPPDNYRRAWWSLLTTSLKQRYRISDVVEAKLDGALRAMRDPNRNDNLVTINSLQDVAKAVATQSNHQIPQADADTMITAVQEIIRPFLRGPTAV